MINQMPLDVIDAIVSHTDVYSIPYLKTTCKTLSNRITNERYDSMVAQHIKKKLEDVINVVKQYHEAITNKDVEEQLFKRLLNQLYSRFYGKKVYFALQQHVRSETSFTYQQCFETYKRYITNQPLEQNDDVIIDSLKKFVIGTDKSVYIVSFNFIDRMLDKKMYYCVVNLQFHDTGDIKMNFSIQNQKIINTVTIDAAFGMSVNLNLRNKSVKRAEIFVTDTTLTELSECIVQEIGREICLSHIQVVNNIEKWIGPLTKYEEKLFDIYVDSLINPYNYRHEIINILS